MLSLAFFSVLSNTEIGHPKYVLGASIAPNSSGIEPNPTVIKTKTAFSQKDIQEFVAIPFETEYTKNPDVEYGIEEVTQEGKEGLITKTYLLTYWGDEEIDKQLTNTERTEPITQIIDKGSKIVWRLKETPDLGRVKYWYKLDVYATKYDGNCYGCSGRTYSGTEVKQGVCATDPRVIPLGTNFYVEGYGFCRAEDIGGAIKGNRVDLGYEVAAQGSWRTGYTTIYLLTNAPE